MGKIGKIWKMQHKSVRAAVFRRAALRCYPGAFPNLLLHDCCDELFCRGDIFGKICRE